jgi:hypothetical protein
MSRIIDKNAVGEKNVYEFGNRIEQQQTAADHPSSARCRRVHQFISLV